MISKKKISIDQILCLKDLQINEAVSSLGINQSDHELTVYGWTKNT